MKKFFIALFTVIALLCFVTACDDNKETVSEQSDKPAIVINLDLNSGKLSWNAVEEAAKYEVIFLQYLHNPVTVETQENGYQIISLKKGDYRITVRAFDGVGAEISVGSQEYTLENGINVLPAPVVTENDGTYTWQQVPSAVGYQVAMENVLSGEVKTYAVSNTSFNFADHTDIPSGKYELKIYALAANGIGGNEYKATCYIAGNTNFNEQIGDTNERVLLDFSMSDYMGFCKAYSEDKTLPTYELKEGALYYTNASWKARAIVYEFPEPISWEQVYRMTFRFRTTGKHGDGTTINGFYAYLYDEEGFSAGIFPSRKDAVYGTESVRQENGVTTSVLSPTLLYENIFSGWSDNDWRGGLSGNIVKIIFSSINSLEEIYLEKITYNYKQESIDGFELLLDGKTLDGQTPLKDTELVDLSTMMVMKNGEKVSAIVKLYKDNEEIGLYDYQRLEEGNYNVKIISTDEKYYGNREVNFTVVKNPVTLPSLIKTLNYTAQTHLLSWDSAENAMEYLVRVQNVNGDILNEQNVRETSVTIDDALFSMGVIRFTVMPLNEDENSEVVFGDPIMIESIVKNSDYLSVVPSGYRETQGIAGYKTVAGFNDAGYENFLIDANDVANVADGYLNLDFTKNGSEKVEYILPEPIDPSQVTVFQVGFKNESDTIAIKMVGEDGTSVTAYCQFTNWRRDTMTTYGIFCTDCYFKDIRFTVDSLLHSGGVLQNWTSHDWSGKTKIVKLVFMKWGNCNAPSINYFNFLDMPSSDTCSFGAIETVNGNTVETIVDFSKAGDANYIVDGTSTWGIGISSGFLSPKDGKDYGRFGAKWGADFICPTPVNFGAGDTLQIRFYCEKDENGNDKCSLQLDVYNQWWFSYGSTTTINSSGQKTRGVGSVTSDGDGWYILSISYEDFENGTADTIEWKKDEYSDHSMTAITKLRFAMPTKDMQLDWVKIVRTGDSAS